MRIQCDIMQCLCYCFIFQNYFHYLILFFPKIEKSCIYRYGRNIIDFKRFLIYNCTVLINIRNIYVQSSHCGPIYFKGNCKQEIIFCLWHYVERRVLLMIVLETYKLTERSYVLSHFFKTYLKLLELSYHHIATSSIH